MKKPFDCITEFIFADDPITKCEVALVPGGSRPQQAQRAAEVYHQGLAEYILFSGHFNPKIPEYASEAEFLKTVAVGLGVPENRILCEDKASHTFENAAFSLELLYNSGFALNRFILICKAYHSRRALLTYQSVFPKNTEFLVSAVTDNSGLYAENWFTRPEYIAKVMGEVEKIGKYFKDKILPMYEYTL